MPEILLLSTDDPMNGMIQDSVSRYPYFELTILKTKTMGIQYLNYELPEINIIHWSDKVIHVEAIVEELMRDPWLHYGACIFIYENSQEAEKIRKLKGINTLTLIEKNRVGHYFNRVLGVLNAHPNLLNQWNFNSLVKSNLDGRFEIDRDAFDLLTYANLLVNFLANANLIGLMEKEKLFTGLLEKLMWIVEHDHGHGQGKIFLEYHVGQNDSLFLISTEDRNFTWERMATSTDNFLSYSVKDNNRSLQIQIQHQKAQGSLVPNIFDPQKQEHFKPGDAVFQQGEESNHLYFIVSGEYEVIANNKRVSTLSPVDVFLGEMSFLLKNKRTATVRALTHGSLIKISKQEYIQTLKEKPQYAFFLARMLAERLAKLHQSQL